MFFNRIIRLYYCADEVTGNGPVGGYSMIIYTQITPFIFRGLTLFLNFYLSLLIVIISLMVFTHAISIYIKKNEKEYYKYYSTLSKTQRKVIAIILFVISLIILYIGCVF